MTRSHPLSRFMPYGAPDLLVSAEPRLTRAVLAGSLTMVLAFALAMVLIPRGVELPVRIIQPTVIIEDAPEIPAYVPPKHEPAAPARPRSDDLGKIEPTVEDKPVEWEDTKSGTGPVDPNARTGEGEPDVPAAVSGQAEESLPVRGVWVHTDLLPKAIVEFKPEYPSFARDAGVEGVVVVHALVDKAGRVIRVEVDEKRSILLLNETALEGARQWVFEPAQTNGHPVPAWVAITFNFTLH